MQVSEELKPSCNSDQIVFGCDMYAEGAGRRIFFKCGNLVCHDVKIDSLPIQENLGFAAEEIRVVCPLLQQKQANM